MHAVCEDAWGVYARANVFHARQWLLWQVRLFLVHKLPDTEIASDTASQGTVAAPATAEPADSKEAANRPRKGEPTSSNVVLNMVANVFANVEVASIIFAYPASRLCFVCVCVCE